MTNQDHEKLLAAVSKAVDWVCADHFPLHEAKRKYGAGALDYAVALGMFSHVAHLVGQETPGERIPHLLEGSVLMLGTFVSLACAHPAIKIPESMPFDKSQLWLAWMSATPRMINAALDKVLELMAGTGGITGIDGELADLLASPRMSWASRGDA